MKKNYSGATLLLILISFLVFAFASCKKNPPMVVDATPKKVGLYEQDTLIYKLLLMAVSKIGTKSVDYGLVFDTGSGGMVMDADSIIPRSMITSSGFNITSDTTVNGITITNQKAIITYGDDANTTNNVYGNLAYASVTIGDQNSGNIVVKRLPFFLYYKVVDGHGNVLDETTDSHEFDVFGVSPQYDITFGNGVSILSPLSYYDPGTGLTKGFKMGALGTANFALGFTYVPDAVTLGLTQADVSSSSGYSMSQLSFVNQEGYNPVIPAKITYNSKTISAHVLFDTGTEPYSYIQDPTAVDPIIQLPSNSPVSIATSSGFNYTYTTAPTEYITYVENTASSGSNVTVFGLEFFLQNSYLLDYTNHTLGVKNN